MHISTDYQNPKRIHSFIVIVKDNFGKREETNFCISKKN
jgi:hypothetical protein